MKQINYEIKAKSSKKKQREIRNHLKSISAKFIGTDNQIDTYFKIPEGRLKIRRGNIENAWIHYDRQNQKDPKKSEIEFYRIPKNSQLEKLTRKNHQVLVKVIKKREIYFLDNMRFHIDQIKDLGNFFEIEAISKNNLFPEDKIKKQCEYYKNIFEIKEEDLISESYSDMILNPKKIK